MSTAIQEAIEWKYQDSFHDWWRVRLWKSGERPTGLENEDSVDFEWAYEVAKEDAAVWTVVHRSELVGQYDVQPELPEIMLDFANHIMGVAIGFPLTGYIVEAAGSPIKPTA